MEQVNAFHKGIISDTDYSKRDNLSWDFPTEGIRVINRKGQGLVVTNMDGNKELFTLASTSENFYVIGAKEFNGILYIASHSPETGYSELGVYPSPVEWSATNTEFERTYKPIHNLLMFPQPPGMEDVVGDFRTTYLNFDMNHPLDILIKQSYDDSVDIYLCDGKNPNRVINSGFKRTGELTGRIYSWESFHGAINLVPSTQSIPTVHMNSVEGGGILPPGTYFAYVRYCTQDFARTHFISQSGPIVVYENVSPNEIKGLQEQDWSTGVSLKTNKKFTLNLANLDPTYKYFEIAILRYSADNENGPAVAHYNIVDQRYLILGTEQSVTITGQETLLATDRIEINRERIPYDISKTIDQVSNRYVGANWTMRNRQYDIAAFAAFASEITIRATLSEKNFFGSTLPHEGVNSHDNGYASLYGMLDYTNASNYSSFFHGQIYPFTIQFVFKDNTVTDAFPMKGNINVDGVPNNKGLFRFPDWSHSSYQDRKKVLGIVPDFLTAKPFYNEELFAEVIGYRIYRGERIDNLLGQGLVLPVYDGVHMHSEEENQFHGINIGTDYDINTSFGMPLIYGALPIMMYKNNNVHPTIKFQYTNIIQQFDFYSDEITGVDNQYQWDAKESFFAHYRDWYTHRPLKEIEGGPSYHTKYGIFVPDLFFEQNPNIPDDIYIEPVVKVNTGEDPGDPWNPDKYTYLHFGDTYYRHPQYCRGILGNDEDSSASMKGRIYPKIGGFQHKVDPSGSNDDLGYHFDDTTEFFHVTAAVIDRFAWKGPLNMKSWLKPGDIMTGESPMAETKTCRSYALNRYVGVKVLDGQSQEYYDSIESCIYGTVNIYKNPNDEEFAAGVVSGFSVSSNLYRPISDILPFDGSDDSNLWKDLNPVFGGDCYYHKTWFRHGRWFSYEGANTVHETEGGSEHDIDFVGDGVEFVDWRPELQRAWQYGALIGIITENKYNTAARNTVFAQDNEGQEVEMTFYPKCVPTYGDFLYWTTLRNNAENEAFQINAGYYQPLSEHYINGYDKYLITSVEYKRANRHYFSEQHSIGSFTDGWRDIKASYFKDFAPQYGEIIAVRAIGNYLVSIFENNIIRHFIDDRELKSDDNSTRIILGTSYNFLSENFVPISSFGSSHKHGIVRSDTALYGVDMKRGIIWRAGPSSAADGSVMIVVEDLTAKHGITTWMEEIKSTYIGKNEFGLIDGTIIPDSEELDDTKWMMYGNGLAGGYNKKYKEVYLTFSWRNRKVPYTGRTDETIIYSEELNGFIGTAPFVSMMYMNLDTEFLKVTYVKNASTNVLEPTEEVRYHDAENCVQQFDGEIKPVTLTIIVNGLTGEGSLSNFEKIYESLRIIMTKVWLTCIRYETESQVSVYTFKTVECGDGKIWEHSEYIEGGWNIPVLNQTAVLANQYYHNDYSNDSEMRGKYLKITLTYHPTEEAEEIIIRSIITAFNPSMA